MERKPFPLMIPVPRKRTLFQRIFGLEPKVDYQQQWFIGDGSFYDGTACSGSFIPVEEPDNVIIAYGHNVDFDSSGPGICDGAGDVDRENDPVCL